MRLTPEIVGSGLISRYLHFVEDHEAPKSMHLVSFLALMSAAVERRLVIDRGYNLLPNVYALLVGPPATRKNYTMRLAKQTFTRAGLGIHEFGKNVTEEGIITDFAALEGEGKSPGGLIFLEELSRLFGAKTYQQGILEFIIDAYDGGAQRTTRRGDGKRQRGYGCEDSLLVFLAATTPKDLKRIPEATMRTGLASRMWICWADGPERRTPKPRFDKGLFGEVVGELRERLEWIGGIPITSPREKLVLGAEGQREFDRWYGGEDTRYQKECPVELADWAGRRADHAMKAAALLHLADEGTLEGFGEEAWRRGLALVTGLQQGAERALSGLEQSEWARKKEYAIELLRRNGGTMGIRQWKAGISHRMERADSTRVLAELEEEGVVGMVEGGKGIRLGGEG